jgi:hypothetical protein
VLTPVSQICLCTIQAKEVHKSTYTPKLFSKVRKRMEESMEKAFILQQKSNPCEWVILAKALAGARKVVPPFLV